MPVSDTSAPSADKRQSFKATIAEYLNDHDLVHARHRTATYFTVALIILSIVVLVMETQVDIGQRYRSILLFADRAIMIVFTIEYLLRIWVATDGYQNAKGWKGAVNYMKSFYGVMDLLAIAPFYIELITPAVHVGFLRVFRLMRVLLLGRYFKSFSLIKRAVLDKKGEILVSLQVVAVLTVILSVLMFEIEHQAKSRKFVDIPTTIGWSISKFIRNDAGDKMEPETDEGKVIGTLIGLLAISLFAVPAGIIASGFIHEVEIDKERQEVDKKRERLKKGFTSVHNIWLGYDLPRRHITSGDAKSHLNISEADIIAAVEMHKGLRLRSGEYGTLLIESFEGNTTYGSCVEGISSAVTIICPTAYEEAGAGHFGRCLSILLDAGYIANDIFGADNGINPDISSSFSFSEGYTHGGKAREELKDFKRDILRSVKPGTLAVIIRADNGMRPAHGLEYGLEHAIDAMAMVPPQGLRGVLALSTGALAREIEEVNMRVASNEHPHDRVREPLLRAESMGRANHDIHTYVQGRARANVVSLYVGRELLQGSGEEEYYRAIGAIAESIKRHLRGIDEAVLVNSRHHVLFTRGPASEVNGQAG